MSEFNCSYSICRPGYDTSKTSVVKQNKFHTIFLPPCSYISSTTSVLILLVLTVYFQPHFQENEQFSPAVYDPFYFWTNLPPSPRKQQTIKYSFCNFESDPFRLTAYILAWKTMKIHRSKTIHIREFWWTRGVHKHCQKYVFFENISPCLISIRSLETRLFNCVAGIKGANGVLRGN